MSYEIYYKRAFIRVKDKFIPMIQHGSNNCTEIFNDREVCEKEWDVSNYSKKGQFLFKETEIQELSEAYSQSEQFKSRHHGFEKEEFQKWFKNGMKSARTIEEYLSFGNNFYINDWTDNKNDKYYPIKNEEELVSKLNEFKGKARIRLSFEERDLLLPKKARQMKEKKKYDFYYILTMGSQCFYRLTRFGYKYTPYETGSLKKFKSEKEAEKYSNKYKGRLHGFIPKKVNEECFL